MFKVRIHSIVDLITNSSTVIFTYQNSIKETKALVQEVLKLSGSDLDPDDVFWYGEFCEEDTYLDYIDEMEDKPEGWGERPYGVKYGSDEYKSFQSLRSLWLEDIQLSIMKGATQPDWMNNAEEGYDWNPDTLLTLVVKDAKYTDLAAKIKALLGSVGADGGRDG